MLLSVVALIALAGLPGRATAQQRDSARAGATRPARDSLRAVAVAAIPKPPISARRAFLYSAMLPGLGQTALDRPTAGAFFFMLEAVSVGMLRKSILDAREAKRFAADSVPLVYKTDSLGVVLRATATRQPQFEVAPNRYLGGLVGARRTHVEDWAAILVFNHLISGADAFVAAQLWDLPTEVRLQAIPRGAALRLSITR